MATQLKDLNAPELDQLHPLDNALRFARSHQKKGPGLIELRSDPMNLRVKRVFLTTAGMRFVRRWLAASVKAHIASGRKRQKSAPAR